MQITLPRLTYAYDALEPYISRATLETHHDKHHRAYVEKTKALAKEMHLADQPLEKIILQTAGQESCRALFNNAAQAWNHAFYWRSLRPAGGGGPQGQIAERIRSDFGNHGAFIEALAAAANGQFGSGWIWLVLDNDKLAITSTSNADTPLVRGQTVLLTLDVWEHAYYLDYQNRRPDYTKAIIGNLLNWEFANHNLSRERIVRIPHYHVEQASRSL
jgi:Fe-Mn family superoxide dismutase